MLPNGYVGTVNKETSSAPGYNRDEENDRVTVNEPNSEMIISTGVNLGFIVMKHGNDFIIWTPRKASETEIAIIKEMVAGESNKVGDQEFSQIKSKGHIYYYGVPNSNISKGNMTASIYMDGDNVKVDFGNKNWSQLAWGQLAYTYTQGRTDLINTQQYTDFEFSKQWIDISQNEIDWDQDIQVTVSSNKADGIKDSSFSLVYTVHTSEVNSATDGIAEFSTGTEADPKLKLTITTEGDKKKYSFKIEGLAYSSETDGKYTYYVEETNEKLDGYLAPSYSNPSAPTGVTVAYDDGTIVNQKEGGYELPSTSGPGTNLIYLLGFTLTGLAGSSLVTRKKQRESA